MKIFIVDPDPEIRNALLGRVREAVRNVELRRPTFLAGDFEDLRSHAGTEEPGVGFLGPGCYQTIEQSVERFKSLFPKHPVAVVLDNDVYASEAFELRRFLAVRLMPLADIAQMAQFVLDSCSQNSGSTGGKERSGIAFVQLKGGVGTTSLSAGFASCLAHSGKATALVDLDDVNPMLTDWAMVNIRVRQAVAEMISLGEVPANRLRELFAAISVGEHSLDFLPQPELYRESFQLKADVVEGAPSSESYIQELTAAMDGSYEVAVFDCGRSWGVAMFALLPRMRQVFLVIDDDRTTLYRTAEALQRLYRESDDPLEFDFGKWHVVLNGGEGANLTESEIQKVFSDFELTTEEIPVHMVPLSETAEQWYEESRNGDRVTLYDRGEEVIRDAIERLAASAQLLRGPHPKGKEKKTVRAKLQKALEFLS